MAPFVAPRSIETILALPAVGERIDALEAFLESADGEDARSFARAFPLVLGAIFGLDAQPAWVALDDSAVMRLLSPRGCFFNTMCVLSRDPLVRYAFPERHLPIATRRALEAGDLASLPRLYEGRIRMTPGGCRVDALNMLEYYFFFFAYYLVKPPSAAPNTQTASGASQHAFAGTGSFGASGLAASPVSYLVHGRVRERPQWAYAAVLRDYIDVFFPIAGYNPPEPPLSDYSPDEALRDDRRARADGRAPPACVFGAPEEGLHANMQQRAQLAEFFVRVAAEFWMHQYSHIPPPDPSARFAMGDVASVAVAQMRPSKDVLQSLTALIGSVWSFCAATEGTASRSPGTRRHAFVAGGHEARTLFASIVRAPLYRFLRVVMAPPPSVEVPRHFFSITGVWLEFARPWKPDPSYRVFATQLGAVDDAVRRGETTLDRLLRQSSAAPGLRTPGEDWSRSWDAEDADGSDKYPALEVGSFELPEWDGLKVDGPYAQFVVDHLPFYTVLAAEFLESAGRASLGDDKHLRTLRRVGEFLSTPGLMEIVRDAEAAMSSTSATPATRRASVAPGSPLGQLARRSFSLLEGTKDPRSCLSGSSRANAERVLYELGLARSSLSAAAPAGGGPDALGSWMANLASSIGRLLFSEPAGREVAERLRPASPEVVRPAVGSSIDYIMWRWIKAFELEPQLPDSSRRPSLLAAAARDKLAEILQPDMQYEEDTLHLSPSGVSQIKTGRKKCSNRDIPLVGHAELRPRSSYEIPWLIPLTVRWSRVLSEKIFGPVAQPPVVSPRTRVRSGAAPVRIDLRFLADGRFYIRLAVFVIALWLLFVLLRGLSALFQASHSDRLGEFEHVVRRPRP